MKTSSPSTELPTARESADKFEERLRKSPKGRLTTREALSTGFQPCFRGSLPAFSSPREKLYGGFLRLTVNQRYVWSVYAGKPPQSIEKQSSCGSCCSSSGIRSWQPLPCAGHEPALRAIR